MCQDDELYEKLNMAEKEYNKDDLVSATAEKVDEYLHDAMMVDGRDDGLDDWFKPNETRGFRIVEPNTIEKCHGYTMGSKEDLYDNHTYIALPKEKKDLIPEPEDEALFLLIGTLKTGETVYTHWLVESARFAQKVSCDWWDDAEGRVLEEWGIEYEEVEDN